MGDDKDVNKIYKDTITQTKTVKFESESEFSGYVFIWPENCKLKLDTSDKYDIIDKKYIQIPVTNINSKNVKISIDSHDSGIENDVCRYYYNYYDMTSTYPLVSNVNYGFKVPTEGFNFEFKVEDETNPSYYILFNKLESGELKINLNNGTQEITITDSYPYRGIYVNRKNLFAECADTEPYNCINKRCSR